MSMRLYRRIKSILRKVATRLRYLRWRLRGSATARVSGVSIVFPIQSGSHSAVGRILGAPHKEPATQQWLAGIAEESPGATLWDIGANIGLFTLLASKLGLKVVAFEPLPASQQMLQLAVAMNGVNDAVIAIPIGLSDLTRIETFYILNASAGISGSSIGFDINSAQYQVMTLAMAGDDLRRMLPERFGSPSAIKIDVDGIESKILSGLRATLVSEELRHIMVEELADESRIAGILSPFGFTLENEENTTPLKPCEYVNRYFKRIV